MIYQLILGSKIWYVRRRELGQRTGSTSASTGMQNRSCDATVVCVTYLHDAVPVVTGRHAKQRQKRHAEVTKVRVFVETFARVLQRTLCTQTNNNNNTLYS